MPIFTPLTSETSYTPIDWSSTFGSDASSDFTVVSDGSLAPANPFGGGGLSVVPMGSSGSASSGASSSLTGILLAMFVLVVLTLSLPEKYGVWLPWIVLLGYGASHASTVAKLLNGGASSVGGTST